MKKSRFQRGEDWGRKCTTLWRVADPAVSRGIARLDVIDAFKAGYLACLRDMKKNKASRGGKRK